MTPKDARAIAKEAYIYGFPLVDSYRINHSYFVDRSSPEFKAPWNKLSNTARVYTPDDKAIQTFEAATGGQRPSYFVTTRSNCVRQANPSRSTARSAVGSV